MEAGFCGFRTFVGRERELDLLRRGLEKASRGQGGLFLVSASRGMGKTSLVEQLTRDAQAMGIQSIFASQRLEENADALPAAGTDDYIEDIAAETVAPPWDSSPGRETCELLLRKTAINRPALLIFEDIHRWSTNNLGSLAILARNILDSRSFAVATCCEREIECDPIRRLRFSDLARFAFHITLAELDEAATRKLAQALLGQEIDPRLAREIFRATGGNPLIVQHSLQAWFVDQERFRKDHFESDTILIPFPVRDLFKRLLGEISRTSSEILNAAAVFSGEFSPDILARVCGLAGRELLDAIDEAERAGLLEKDPDRKGHFRFRHSLLRELLYRTTSSFQRAELHRRAARAIEALDGTTPGVASKIVDHLHRALNQNGYDGHANGSFEGGAEAETRARADFLVWFGENQVRVGSYEAALATLTSARKLAERLGDAARLAKIALALPNHLLPLPGAPNFDAILLAKNVLGGGQMLDAGLRAQVCARLAAELSYLPEEFERAQELMNEALEVASSYPPEAQLRIGLYRDSLLRGPEALDQRIDNACTVGDLAVSIGDGAAAHFAFLTKAIAHLERGETACAQSAWHFAVAAAGTTPGRSEKLSLGTFRAARAFCEGRLPETRALLREADAADDADRREFALAAEALVSRELELSAEAHEAAQQVAERWPGTAMYCALLALTELDLGRERDARFHFERVFGDEFLHVPHNGMFLPCGALLAELCTELRDLKPAAQLYSTLIPYGARFAVMGQALVLGPVSLHLGILANALQRFGIAQQHLEEALRMSRSSGLRLWSAYANYHLAQCLALSGDSIAEAQSRRCIGAALAEAEALGMVRLLNKARSLQGSVLSPTVVRRSGSGGVNESDGSREPAGAAVIARTQKSRGLEFSEEAETYLLTYRERFLRLRKSKGLKLILTLIRDPGREFHVLDLESAAGNSHGRESNSTGEGGPQLDATAKQSYRTRLQDLREELEEAQRFNDSHRVSMIEEEIGFLARELARAVGLKGADRKTFSDAERARVRVTQGIHSALRRISDQDAAIGWYLVKAVRTGTFCSFRPVLEDHKGS